MKIIIPVLGFGRAGGYRVLSQFANEWIKHGHDVDFLCPDSGDEPYFPTSAGIVWVDGAGNLTRVRATIAKPSGWYHLKTLFLGLKEIGSQYDIIFANHSLTAWPVALASCGHAKKVYYVQAYEPEYYTSAKTIKGYLLATVSALSYHLSLNRVVNAPIYFRYKNLRAAQFVPPGLDLENFKPSESIRNLENAKTIIIGCIGRHEPEKGTIYVLRAFEELYKKDKRFLLRVAYGNLPEDWKHEQCEVVVPKNDQELADYYRSLDILVAPGTVQHGAPHYPVLEAGACGVAVVTTGYMGATPETAWIVRNKDVESIVNSIIDIASDDKQRMKKRSIFLNETLHFSWEYVSKKMLKIFQQNG
ncbi:MAG: glycosyltransferase family 4 protein [Sideroxydans sp.]|nr:glycosyltransferase family 4 protein [Sideroxydans sp.]